MAVLFKKGEPGTRSSYHCECPMLENDITRIPGRWVRSCEFPYKDKLDNT